MFVTTAGRTTEERVRYARKVASELNVEFVHRKKQSVLALQHIREEDCLVVGKERLELYPLGEKEPFFFHPNSAMFRIKRLINGESDPLAVAAQLRPGMTFLDCSLGLGADSIVASFLLGEEGEVTGLEARSELSYIVYAGLNSWDSGVERINQAMRRIEVINSHSLDFLKKQADNSFDCVYFDPMFDETILESDGIKGLSRFAIYEGLSQEMIDHAIRVASKRVILKDHFRSKRFEQFNFNVFQRKSAKFHFGVKEKGAEPNCK